jgi:hypothetical protein
MPTIRYAIKRKAVRRYLPADEFVEWSGQQVGQDQAFYC